MRRQPVTIVLLGTTGTGKSSTGNTLLGTEVFTEGAGMAHVTETTEAGKVSTGDYDLTVIDTPGFFDAAGDEVSNLERTKPCRSELQKRKRLRKNILRNQRNEPDIEDLMRDADIEIRKLEDQLKTEQMEWRKEQVERSILACCLEGGIHAFLVVLSCQDRFTDNTREMLSLVERMYGGSNFLDHTFLLLTHANHMVGKFCRDFPEAKNFSPEELDQLALQHYIQSDSATIEPLHEFLDEIDYRVLQIDNTRAKKQIESQCQKSQEIFGAIMQNVHSNCNGQPFTTDQIKACRKNLFEQVGIMAPELEAPRQKLAEANERHQKHKEEMTELQQQLGIEKGLVSRRRSELKYKLPLGMRTSNVPLAAETGPQGNRKGDGGDAEPGSSTEQEQGRGQESLVQSSSGDECTDDGSDGQKFDEEVEILNLMEMTVKAEKILKDLTEVARDKLMAEHKWAQRGAKVAGFFKGLFLLSPRQSLRTVSRRLTIRKSIEARTQATKFLKDQFPEVYDVLKWQTEGKIDQWKTEFELKKQHLQHNQGSQEDRNLTQEEAEALAVNEIECSICCVEKAVTEFHSCSEGHPFCSDCIENQARNAFVAHESMLLKCLNWDCDGILEIVLSSDVMKMIDTRYQEDSLVGANLENMEHCPNCGYGMIVEDSKVEFPILTCPECDKSVCRTCKRYWTEEHEGRTCEEVNAAESKSQARKSLEERLSAVAIRECHKCHLRFDKEEGCNRMTCRCGATMCFLCRQPDIDYLHFCQHPRDPGMACTECDACSLWEDPKIKDKEIMDQLSSAETNNPLEQ